MRRLRSLLGKEQRRFIKFCVVGFSGVPVNLLITWLGYQVLFAGLEQELRNGASYILGIGISIFTNFLLNDIWTWRDRTHGGEKPLSGFWGRLLRFYLVCGAGAGLQFGTAMALSLWLQMHYLLAQVVGIGVATAVNFVANNLWTYRKGPPPPEK